MSSTAGSSLRSSGISEEFSGSSSFPDDVLCYFPFEALVERNSGKGPSREGPLQGVRDGRFSSQSVLRELPRRGRPFAPVGRGGPAAGRRAHPAGHGRSCSRGGDQFEKDGRPGRPASSRSGAEPGFFAAASDSRRDREDPDIFSQGRRHPFDRRIGYRERLQGAFGKLRGRSPGHPCRGRRQAASLFDPDPCARRRGARGRRPSGLRSAASPVEGEAGRSERLRNGPRPASAAARASSDWSAPSGKLGPSPFLRPSGASTNPPRT